jgi:hypothetical protein
MGLDPRDELKYAIYEDHPSYARLEQGDWPRSRRLPAMLAWLTEQPVLLLADTVHDWRPGDRAHVKDLYVHALGWCLRRAANYVEFDLGAPTGPHSVLVDMPNGVHRVSDDNRTWLLRSLGNSLATAAFALYQSRYLDPEPFPSGDGSALAALGFQPELHAAHAKHSDLLQSPIWSRAASATYAPSTSSTAPLTPLPGGRTTSSSSQAGSAGTPTVG